MSFKINQATINDVKMIAPLFDAYRMFYKQPSNENAAADFLRERLYDNESVIFIASSEGHAIGFCQLFPIFSSVGLKRTWLLNDLFVIENTRGQGVATGLLNKAKEFGKETNAKWLMLQTGADNITAQSLYEKNGWNKITDFFYELPLNEI